MKSYRFSVMLSDDIAIKTLQCVGKYYFNFVINSIRFNMGIVGTDEIVLTIGESEYWYYTDNNYEDAWKLLNCI